MAGRVMTLDVKAIRAVRVALLLALLVVVPFATHAATVVAESDLLPQYWAAPVADWAQAAHVDQDPRYRTQILAEFADELARDDYLAILRALADRYRDGTAPSQADPAIFAAFAAHFDSVVTDFAAAVAATGGPAQKLTLKRRSVMSGSLRYNNRSLLPDKPLEGLSYFSGSTDRFTVWEYTDDDSIRLLVEPETALDLRLRGDAVAAVLDDFLLPVKDVALHEIVAADARWENYLTSGYSQYPWESLVNGVVLSFDALHPPRAQWILLHPGLGVELSTLTWQDIRGKGVVNLELLGHLRYTGDSGQNYLGASVTATFREDMGTGLGLLLHPRRNIHLGLVWHPQDRGGEESPYVFMTWDFFRLVQARQGALAAAAGT